MQRFQNAVSSRLGFSETELRGMTFDQHRERVQSQTQKDNIVSHHPLVGRGSVIHDKLVSRDQLQEEVDAIIDDK